MTLYRELAPAHLRSHKRALYRQIVIHYLGCTAAAAESILESAEDSYTSWPVQRTLTFRDVAHYLAATYLTSDVFPDGWTRVDIRGVVASIIPERL